MIDHCNLLILWWEWEVAPSACPALALSNLQGAPQPINFQASDYQTTRLLLAHSSFFVFTFLSSCLNTFQPNTPPTLYCNLCNSICLQDSSLWDCQWWKSWDKDILSLGSSSLLLVFSKSSLSYHWKRSDTFKWLCNSLNSERLLADYCLLKLNKWLPVCRSSYITKITFSSFLKCAH